VFVLFIPFSSSLAKLLFIALSLLFSVFLLCIFHSETVSRLIAFDTYFKKVTPALFSLCSRRLYVFKFSHV